MKILHVVRQFFPMIGGLENYVYHLAIQQIKQGHNVAVVSLDKNFLTDEKLSQNDSVNGLTIIRVPYSGSKRYPIAPAVLMQLKSYEVVNVHAVDFFADFLAVTRIFHGKKMVLTTHGGFFHTDRNRALKKIYFNSITRLTIKAYDSVIACSENDLKVFSKITEKVNKIDNGVNVTSYLNTPKKRNRGELLYVGRIDVHKRVDRLIETTALLLKRGYDIKLNILGPDWNNLLPGLENLSNDLGIRDKVYFRGAVNDNELTEAQSSADIFVSASEYEGFGISAVEAMASGSICVLNDIESFRNLLEKKSFGKVTDFKDTSKAADAIAGYLNYDDKLYEAASIAARTFSRQFDWENVAMEITKAYI
jgi:alpha-1,3-mannosyltransferase